MPEAKSSVPKFASFKPKPPTLISNEVGKEKSPGDDARDPIAHQKRHQQKNHHRRRQSVSRGEKLDEVTQVRRSDFKSEGQESSQNVFIIDRKGDAKNLAYGSIHRYDVPSFYRFGAGRVLGALSGARIDKSYGEDKGLVLSHLREGRRVREKYIFSRVERERPRLLKIRAELVSEDGSSSALNFLPLVDTRGTKRRTAGVTSEDGSEADADTHYRSIHGHRKPSSHPDDEYLRYATESDSSGSDTGHILDVDATLRAAGVILQRQVDQSPHSVGAWLALIEHQEKLMRSGDAKRRITNAETRSTAEIKIHMYEKALESVTSLNDREKLLMGLMEEGAKIWEVKTQASRWEQISKENIESLLLWKSYVNFKQTTFAEFRYEEVLEVYLKRIKLLVTSATKLGHSSYFRQLLYVLLRCTLFLRQSGYTELSIAIWQGLLELNFCASTQNGSKSSNVHDFKEFWESEVARIGDDGALGWGHFTEHPEASDAPIVFADASNSHLDGRNIFRDWAVAERERRNASRMPARTLDDVTEDDPFRVILFSDIEPFLVFLAPDSYELRHVLLDSFLLFCGLPPMAPIDQDGVQTDSYVPDHLLNYSHRTIKENYFKTQKGGEQQDVEFSSMFKEFFLDFPTSSESSLGSKHWFQRFQSWQELFNKDEGPVTFKFVQNCLQQLTSAHFHEEFAELHLAFERCNAPETIKKTARVLLKQYPTSLRCYNAYAMIEWARGHKEAAVGVFSAALTLGNAGSVGESDECILLWKSWVWACLEDLDNGKALGVLLSIPDGTPNLAIEVTPTALLKAKQHLSSNFDYSLSRNNPRLAIIFAELLALLHYLNSMSTTEPQSATQGDISSALSTISAFSQTLISRAQTHSTPHELMLLSASRLLQHHIRIGPYRPSFVRTYLTTYITFFPQNTAFLTLYSANESRLRISNRVRTILLSTIFTPQNDSLSARIFAIHHEIRHGTVHSVRSAFEHAVASPAARGSAGLWRLYMAWCWETSAFRPLMKEVWVRAVKACPWVVELYRFGLEKLDGIVEFGELQRMWRVLGEKELRVHVDLEETFEDVDEQEKRRKESRDLQRR